LFVSTASWQRVELGPPVVFGCAVRDRDPAAFDEAVQCRIERALLDAQHFVGITLNRFRDRVAVRGSEQQRAQDEQVQRALQQFDVLFRFSHRPSM
jgi:hypothetical protein